MTFRKAIAIPVLGAFLLLGFAACEKQEGPAEKAGEKVDKAAEKAGEKMEDTGEKMKDTAR